MPWVVEPSDESELDQARVQAVIGELTQVGASCLDVTLAVPAAIGLTGPEAEQLGVGFGQGGNIGSRFSNGGTFGGRDFGTFGRVFQ